jgi:hypothetical protein
MITFISSILGCVYTLIDDELFYTPMMKDGSFSNNEEDFVEVDHMALLGEEEFIRQEVERVENILRGNFAPVCDT